MQSTILQIQIYNMKICNMYKICWHKSTKTLNSSSRSNMAAEMSFQNLTLKLDHMLTIYESSGCIEI